MANDTFIPEIQNQRTDLNSLYSRGSAQNSSSNNGTLIPGMQQVNQGDKPNSNAEMQGGIGNSRPLKRESVVGFLYSISRMGLGEFWPLHLGSNKIGRSDSCDVQLKEQTVSDRHATISVKKMKTTGELVAMIRDDGSKNGMFLNDEELDYEQHKCKNGDIVTIGLHYKFVLILINAEKYGLKVEAEFQPVEEAEQAAPIMPEANPSPLEDDTLYGRRGPYVDDGTVDLGGASPYMGGGTSVL